MFLNPNIRNKLLQKKQYMLEQDNNPFVTPIIYDSFYLQEDNTKPHEYKRVVFKGKKSKPLPENINSAEEEEVEEVEEEEVKEEEEEEVKKEEEAEEEKVEEDKVDEEEEEEVKEEVDEEEDKSAEEVDTEEGENKVSEVEETEDDKKPDDKKPIENTDLYGGDPLDIDNNIKRIKVSHTFF